MTTPEQPRDLPDDHVGGGEHREREVRSAALATLIEAKLDRVNPSNRRDDLPMMLKQTYGQLRFIVAVLNQKAPAPVPPPSADAAMVEEVARLIDPMPFKHHRALYEYCLACGDTEADARRVSDDTHKPDCDRLIATAKSVLDLASRQHAGVVEGFVLVPRILPIEVRDAMTEVEILTGFEGKTTALNWEEAQAVWDAALAMLEPLPAAPATDEGEVK